MTEKLSVDAVWAILVLHGVKFYVAKSSSTIIAIGPNGELVGPAKSNWWERPVKSAHTNMIYAIKSDATFRERQEVDVEYIKYGEHDLYMNMWTPANLYLLTGCVV